ncbi:MAG: VWA domain-containing protein [Anaerolineae bacterium]
MTSSPVFPFTAIVGQEQLKLALVLNIINPACGGVLLVGERGTAKSTAVRALAQLMPGLKVVTLPLNATEDRVVGALDMTVAIRRGHKQLAPGLLAEADGHILYVDEVNLLAESLVNAILDAVSSGVNIVEREGVSQRHNACFSLVGSMNPEEGQLRPQLLDRFGLCVTVGGEAQLEQRIEVVRRRLAFEAQPLTFIESYLPQERMLRDRIVSARQRLAGIDVSDEALEHASHTALLASVAGHRADLVLIQAARALAAWQGQSRVMPAHVDKVAPLVLVHRRREPPEPSGASRAGAGQSADSPSSSSQNPADSNKSADQPLANEPMDNASDRPTGKSSDGEQEDQVFEVGSARSVAHLLPALQDRISRRRGSGRRSKTRTHAPMGRYVRYALPRRGSRDLALDATLRAAAPWQSTRRPNGLAVRIESQDLRVKVRERRTGYTIIFLVDASGSMGVQRRMAAAKGAVMALLQEAYQKRDTVGLLTFRHASADLVLPPTRSTLRAARLLHDLPSGGRTPLAFGLCRTVEVVKALQAKDREVLPVVVLISDGRANVALQDGDPFEEALTIAARAAATGIRFVVVDTETGFVRLGLARQLCEALGGIYIQLDDVSASGLTRSVLGRQSGPILIDAQRGDVDNNNSVLVQ